MPSSAFWVPHKRFGDRILFFADQVRKELRLGHQALDLFNRDDPVWCRGPL